MLAGPTLTEIKTSLQAKGYGSDTDTAQTQLINTAYRKVLGMRRWSFLAKTATFTTTPGTRTIDLSTADLTQVLSVRLVVPEGSDPLDFMPVEDFQDMVDMDPRNSSQPDTWTRDGATLSLFPTPDRAYTVTVRYVFQPPVLASGTDVLVIPRAYEDAVVWQAVMQLTFRQRDWGAMQMAKQEFTEVAREMIALYGKEQAQSTRTVKHWSGWDSVQR